MKLVEIKDVRPGQIWKHNKTGLFHKIEDTSYLISSTSDLIARRNAYLKECSLMGFIGITHEIKDNELVEIPRDEFQIDDVVTVLSHSSPKNINTVVVELNRCEIITFDGYYYCGCPTVKNHKFFPLKIGILGVTHEFVNERLAK